ncbi:SidA/IucD/PvdA family monooxygenase [Pseudonocardia xishanensis]|uniref:L-lysine N6-monooxygenase MbtG n=1 Tax=Pseudonocardia xishanensis TaxID=630995 RepID=A0ABP8RW74_9PSEU
MSQFGPAYPTRIEFHDFLEWVARRFADVVDGTAVTAVNPVPGSPDVLDVVTALGTLRTRNVVLATGLTPNLPDGLVPGERIGHSRDLLDRLDRVADPRRAPLTRSSR